ncbi:hypothetical protein T12_693 [Trichinella patagoniensis]|uniref:Uncharacterized protein n=1 Tax=Trichinella patagoniensis TaxID=990121 RepID=A0A0V0ZED8_9BILA|nr:hypothetical protein T12_693 [Trichinella patagoniensis]
MDRTEYSDKTLKFFLIIYDRKCHPNCGLASDRQEFPIASVLLAVEEIYLPDFYTSCSLLFRLLETEQPFSNRQMHR